MSLITFAPFIIGYVFKCPFGQLLDFLDVVSIVARGEILGKKDLLSKFP